MKLKGAIFAVMLSATCVFAAASLNDSAVLSTDTTFQNRVKASLVSSCIAISSEAVTGLTGNVPIAVHIKKANYCVGVLAAPDSYKTLFALTIATDATCLGGATSSGTVVLTSGNVAAQAAGCTDTMISNGVAGQLAAYMTVP